MGLVDRPRLQFLLAHPANLVPPPALKHACLRSDMHLLLKLQTARMLHIWASRCTRIPRPVIFDVGRRSHKMEKQWRKGGREGGRKGRRGVWGSTSASFYCADVASSCCSSMHCSSLSFSPSLPHCLSQAALPPPLSLPLLFPEAVYFFWYFFPFPRTPPITVFFCFI